MYGFSVTFKSQFLNNNSTDFENVDTWLQVNVTQLLYGLYRYASAVRNKLNFPDQVLPAMNNDWMRWWPVSRKC